MACYRQRLDSLIGEEIGYVEDARHEDDPELSLADAMKAHVEGLRHL